jgi:hypothetical protein
MRPTSDGGTAVIVEGEAAADISEAVSRLGISAVETLKDIALQDATRSRLVASAPPFEDILDQILLRLRREPYFARVSGLPFDPRNLLLVLLTGAFGVIEPYALPGSTLVRAIEAATDVREGDVALNERLHTDGTNWPEPNMLTCLLCIRVDDAGGGLSRLLSLEGLRRSIAGRAGDDVVATLEATPVPWAIDERIGGHIAWQPVLGAQGLRWLRQTIELAVERGAAMPRTLLEALDLVELAAENAESLMEFLIHPGELLIVHNRLCLHARSPVGVASRRLMLRTKVGQRAGGNRFWTY